jgi:hypothetical protein
VVVQVHQHSLVVLQELQMVEKGLLVPLVPQIEVTVEVAAVLIQAVRKTVLLVLLVVLE